MNTPAQCGVIKPPKTDIYSEAPHGLNRARLTRIAYHRNNNQNQP